MSCGKEVFEQDLWDCCSYAMRVSASTSFLRFCPLRVVSQRKYHPTATFSKSGASGPPTMLRLTVVVQVLEPSPWSRKCQLPAAFLKKDGRLKRVARMPLRSRGFQTMYSFSTQKVTPNTLYVMRNLLPLPGGGVSNSA